MKFFSGFGFQKEEELFVKYLPKSDFCIAGFSYGAQKAIEYALSANERVDRVILLSPAYFDDKPKTFKQAQMRYFKLDREKYMKAFLSNTIYPQKNTLKTKFLSTPNVDDLEKLLYFIWEEKAIETLKKRGITVEVFLGADDKIVNTKEANSFFSNLTTTYFIKNAGHIL